jgi:hypothetical protein
MIKDDEPFFTLAHLSPFTAMIHVHDRIWTDRSNWNLEDRIGATDLIRAITFQLIGAPPPKRRK